MRRELGVAAALLLALTCNGTPAVANEEVDSVAVETSVETCSFLTLSEVIGFSSGIQLKVVYTYNDAYGIISGIQSVSLYRSGGMTDISWSYQRCNGGEYYVFTVEYLCGGEWGTQTAKLWA